MNNLFDDLFSTLRFKSAVYFKHGFCKPWGMEVPNGNFAQFHLVTGGTCIMIFNGQEFNLEKGDVVIFPYGDKHQIKDSIHSNCMPGKKLVMDIISGKELCNIKIADAHLICGHYELDRSLTHPIFDKLPKLLIIKSAEYGRFDLIYAIFEMISEELTLKKAGYQTVSLKLAEILFISIIRHYYINQTHAKSNLFKDILIFDAIELIHSHLTKDWTIESLARKVGISRTLFINRFKAAVGETPIRYLTNWRMTKAKYLLKNTDISLSQIGINVGYPSETSFNRIFKQKFSITPGKFRQENVNNS